MRSFVSQFNDKLLKRTDYILSRQHGVLTRTTYIDTTSTDSTQAQVNEESKYDDVRDKHGIYGAMIYDDHYQLDFPCYESCLLYKVTFQIISAFDEGTKIGIFNEKAPVVILDVPNPGTAAEIDFYQSINTILAPSSNIDYILSYDIDHDSNQVPIKQVYTAANTDYPSNPDHDPPYDRYGRDSNIMPDPSLGIIKEEDIFKFTGTTYTSGGRTFTKGNYYRKFINIFDQASWMDVYGMSTLGYECYKIHDYLDRVYRVAPRIINVDPYETEDGVPVPINIHARVIGNESASAFGYLTVETYPIQKIFN